MGEPKKITEAVQMECNSANVVAVVERLVYPDTAKDINALDCKSNVQNFERLLRHFIEQWARAHELTPEQFLELVPEEVMRAAVRKAVDRHKPGSCLVTTYASWWFRQGVVRYLAQHGRRLPSKRPQTEHESPGSR